ncbi:MAG: TlpA family protein disulfide reductase [Usitatibacter sp.]
MADTPASPAPKLGWLFSLIALLALMAGTSLWLGTRSPGPSLDASDISPAAPFSAAFADTAGLPASLGRFQGKVLVVNFWATWCAPCREEMPAFARLQARWGPRGVQFVGLSAEDPALVKRFAEGLRVDYPLWVGGDEVGNLARRLGNRLGVLPFTVLVDARGTVLDRRVGTYTEKELDERLRQISSN